MRRKLFSKYLINQKGYSLLITIFALALITIIALSATALSINTMKISSKERITQAGYYIAEAGLVERKVEFVDLVETAYADTVSQQATYYLTNSTQFDFETEFKNNVIKLIGATSGFLDTNKTFTYEKNLEGEAEAIVKIEKSPIPDLDYRITSTGKIGSSVETIVYQDYKIGLLDPVSENKNIVSSTGTGTPSEMIPPTKGAYALGKITAKGNIHLNTTLYSSQPNKSGDDVHKKFEGKVVWGEKFDFKLPPFPHTAPPQGTEKKSITGTSMSLDKDIEITSLPNSKITIDVGSEDRNIYLDASVYEGKEIQIIGTGKVSIFISKASSKDGSTTINPNITYGKTGDKLTVYLDKGVKLGSNLNVDGSLYAADSGFTTQGDSVVRGTLYLGGDSSDVKITGNGDIIGSIFSPNNSVEIKGTPIIYGSIVANNLDLGGNMTLNSGQGTVSHIPVEDTTTTTVQEVIGSGARFEASNVKVK